MKIIKCYKCSQNDSDHKIKHGLAPGKAYCPSNAVNKSLFSC